MIDDARNRQYLLEKTQHLIGGFGKGVGDPPGKVQDVRGAANSQLIKLSRSSPLVLWHGLAGVSGRTWTGSG